MKKIALYLAFLAAIGSTVSAQTTGLIIHSDIVMLKDSLENKSLIHALESFLTSAEENNINNNWVLDSEREETYILIDEIQDIKKNEALKNDNFFKAHLTNITPIENNKYLVNIAYIGLKDKSAVLRANFELIAHKSNDTYLISSPLLRNTQNWESLKIKNHTFYYPYSINNDLVQEFVNQTIFYDEMLKNNKGETHYYLCSEEINPLKLIGLAYKLDYNSEKPYTTWSSESSKKTLLVLNDSNLYGYDSHDLWHNRLSQVISRRKVHRRVDCHIAYLYGGSWGFGWEELFNLFSEKFVVGKHVDWLEHKQNSSYFETHQHKNYTDDFIGALLVKKIEAEKGFDGVWELLMTKRTKEEEEYFTVLNKLIGISKKNYNKEVQKLIEAEIKNLEIL